MTSLVLTLIGADRPGLVEAISEVVAAHGGNWLESRMARLAGQFAGILHIEIAAEQTAELQGALERLAGRGLRVQVENASPPSNDGTAQTSMQLDLVGQDRPGIVKEIAQFLASRQVNVEELITNRESAAMSGEQLFRARARVKVPASVAASELRTGLERIAADLMVEIQLADAD